MRRILVTILALFGVLSVAACSRSPEGDQGRRSAQSPPAEAGSQANAPVSVARWYSLEQVKQGGSLFQQHCAECHKADASGDPNWKQPNAEGKLPPPPLNGTAHAWHHPLPLLRQIVRNGGIPMGGSMPPFKDKLSAEQIDAILAWVQSHWTDRIYAAWDQINRRKQH
jgi:mono/diheme cytochrome c family protein